jgi:hypothetical protein
VWQQSLRPLPFVVIPNERSEEESLFVWPIPATSLQPATPFRGTELQNLCGNVGLPSGHSFHRLRKKSTLKNARKINRAQLAQDASIVGGW